MLSDGASPRVRPILWLFSADGAYLGDIHGVPGSEEGVFRLDGQLPERADIVSTRLVLSMVRV